MHLGIPLPVLILSGTWCTDQGGIHDGAPTEFQALLLKGLSHQREQSAPQMVAFQEMTELAQGGLVRHGFPRPKSIPTNQRIARESYSASSATGSERLNQCCRK